MIENESLVERAPGSVLGGKIEVCIHADRDADSGC